MNGIFKPNTFAILEREGVIPENIEYYAFGNVVFPKLVLIFEDRELFERAIRGFDNPHNHLFICSLGVPAQACLDYVAQMKFQKIIYFGDLSPTSLLTCMSFAFLKRAPKPGDKPKKCVIYGGLTARDYSKYVNNTIKLEKLSHTDNTILRNLEYFKMAEISEELAFLKEKKVMVPLREMSEYGFVRYVKEKLNRANK